MNYLIKTANPITRAGVIRKLMKKGYSLAGGETVSTYFTRWSASLFPYVLVMTSGRYARKPAIDLRSSNWRIEDGNITTVQWNQIDKIPAANKSANTKENQVNKKALNKVVMDAKIKTSQISSFNRAHSFIDKDYYFRCPSNEERNKVIKTLQDKGYQLFVNDALFYLNYPFTFSPNILARRTGEKYSKKPIIDTAGSGYRPSEEAVILHPSQVNEVPALPGFPCSNSPVAIEKAIPIGKLQKFHVVTRSSKERGRVLDILRGKGYGSTMPAHLIDNYYPWSRYPNIYVGIINEHEHQLNACEKTCRHPVVPTLSIRELEELPAKAKPVPELRARTETPKALVLPEASKYTLVYEKTPGDRLTYTVSNPIESNSDSITCYAFGHGVRSFKRAKIRAFDRIK